MASTNTLSVAYEGEQGLPLLFQPEVMATAGIRDFELIINATGKMQLPELAGFTNIARDGADCANTTVGTATVTDKAVTPVPIAWNMDFCKTKWLPSYTAGDFPANGNDFQGTDLAQGFETKFNENVTNEIFDIVFWGNADATTDTSLYLRDHDVSGLYLSWNSGSNMNQASDFSTGLASGFTTGTTTTLNKDEGWDILENLIEAQPLEMVSRPDRAYHITYSIYNNLRQSLSGYNTSASALQVVPGEVVNGVQVLSYNGIPIYTHPRWDKVLRANTAIPFVHFAVLTPNANNVIAVDGEDFFAKVWYSMDDDNIKMRSNLRLDVEIKHDELYVAYKAV